MRTGGGGREEACQRKKTGAKSEAVNALTATTSGLIALVRQKHKVPHLLTLLVSPLHPTAPPHSAQKWSKCEN